MRRSTACLILPLLTAGCGSMQPSADVPEPSTAQAWSKALNECRVDALVALYHSEALFWPTTSRSLATKPEDVRRYYDAACKISRMIGMKVGIDSERVIRAGDAVLSAGQFTASFTAVKASRRRGPAASASRRAASTAGG